MRKVLELNGQTEILSFFGVILLFQPHFPVFPLCFGYYLTEFVPLLFHESDIALIFSGGKQFLDNYLRRSNNQITSLRTALKNPIHLYSSHHRPLIPPIAN